VPNPIFTTTSEEFTRASKNYDVVPVSAVIKSIQKAKAPLLAIARAEATQDHYWRSDDQSSPEIPQPATMQLISD
jgi:hypothetical protein|tara:strand:+ start:1927 stop:2151 length:225 start_codon:yes stop_codon:yes gene_type:complete